MDPLGGMRSSISQSKKSAKSVESRLSRVKSVKKKSARLDAGLVKHFLMFLAIGIFLGLNYFLPFYRDESYYVKPVFASFALIGLLLGVFHQRRILKKFEWSEYGDIWPESLITLASLVVLYLGTILLWLILPLLGVLNQLPASFQLIMASGLVLFVFPLLIQAAYVRALEIEPKKYKLWHFPTRPMNHDPGWNPDRVIFANLKFSKSIDERVETTVKARLPIEAEFGQLLHLFFLDYNENRSPEDPVQDITGGQDKIGWMFYSKKRIGKKILNPEVSIFDNGIKEDETIYLARIVEED